MRTAAPRTARESIRRQAYQDGYRAATRDIQEFTRLSQSPDRTHVHLLRFRAEELQDWTDNLPPFTVEVPPTPNYEKYCARREAMDGA
jgi:hypothetical protein